MNQPSHAWGVYVVQGAAIAVKLRRTHEAALEIESAYVEANDGKTLPLHVASMMLARRGMRGELAVVALPDSGGFLSTVRLSAKTLAHPETKIAHELYEETPFDEGHAELRHVRVKDEDGDQIHLVAAVKRSHYAAALHELAHKQPHPAIAFGGAATIRGARALGLCPDPCVLVEVEPHVTVAYLVERGHVRRRVLPFGEHEIAKDAAHCDKLIQELLEAADAAPPGSVLGEPMAPRAPKFVLVGPGAASRAVREFLEKKLGERLVAGRSAGAHVRVAADARLHGAPPAALAGAVGAALEAFTPPEERLLFHPLPEHVHPQTEHAARPWGIAVAATLVLAAAYGARQATRPAAPAARPTFGDAVGGGPEEAEAAAAPVQPATVRSATIRVEPIGPGTVRVSWPAGGDGRVLRRHDGAWKEVAKLAAAEGSIEDDVAGGTQMYGWRLDGEEPVFADVDVPVRVELMGPSANGGARFTLRRTWKGGERKALAEAAPGEPIRATEPCGAPPVDVVFDTGCRLVGARRKTEKERLTASVPSFGADGRVARGADGAPVLAERTVERDREVFEAEGVTSGGQHKTWTLRPGPQ